MPQQSRSSSRTARPADPGFTRPALAPGLLGAVVLLACLVLIGDGVFLFVRMAITVLALIILVFAIRGRSVIGIVLAALIAVCWNPVVSLPIPTQIWGVMQLVAAVAFVALGILVTVPRER